MEVNGKWYAWAIRQDTINVSINIPAVRSSADLCPRSYTLSVHLRP